MRKFLFVILYTVNFAGFGYSQKEKLIELASAPLFHLNTDQIVLPVDAKRIEATYGPESEHFCVERIRGLKGLQELHLRLECGTYSFDYLKELPQIKILTISFYEAGENWYTACGSYERSFDLSFLSSLTHLKILVIEWDAPMIHQEAIVSLKELNYLNLPIVAFDPVLLNSNYALQQLTLGKEKQFIFFRNSRNNTPFQLDGNISYGEQFSRNNKKYLSLLKSFRKPSTTDWPSEYYKETVDGDTLMFISNHFAKTVYWKFLTEDKSYSVDGTKIIDREKFRSIRNIESKALLLRTEQVGNESITLNYINNNTSSGNIFFGTLTYKDGLKEGTVIGKDYSGRIFSEEHYAKGNIVYTYPYNGIIPELPKLNGVYYTMFGGSRNATFDEGELVLLQLFGNTENDISKNMFISISYSEGLPDGPVTVKDGDGNYLLKATYSKGVLNGAYDQWIISEEDSTHYILNYSNGEQNGKQQIFRKNSTTTYFRINGKLTDSKKVSNVTGQVLATYQWNAVTNQFESRHWSEKGQLISYSAYDSEEKKNGVQLDYYENGKIHLKQMYTHGKKTGNAIEYDLSGKIKSH